MSRSSQCWCRNADLQPFSGDYLHCAACELLVLARLPEARALLVEDDERDFYGKHYFEALARDYEKPPIEARARAGLSERCLHWLRILLKYQLLPACVLEIGCAHGGLVALMRWTGFDAVGLDLSPWEAERRAVDVEKLTVWLKERNLRIGDLEHAAAERLNALRRAKNADLLSKESSILRGALEQSETQRLRNAAAITASKDHRPVGFSARRLRRRSKETR